MVERIDTLVDDGMVESKSELYRFSAEYVPGLIETDHEVKTVNFEVIKSELDVEETDPARALGADGGTFFLDAVITVRNQELRGNYEADERFIDTHYDATDQECIILEELLGTYRDPSSP